MRHTIKEFGDDADSGCLGEDSTWRWMSVGAMDTRKNVEREGRCRRDWCATKKMFIFRMFAIFYMF
jgi:hypothetical protein